jgi:hypothetical protein
MNRNAQHRPETVEPPTPALKVFYRGQTGSYTGHPGICDIELEIAAGNVPGIGRDRDVSLDGYIIDLASRTVRPSTAFAFGGAR